MISKQYFDVTFSLATAQALQTWADTNLIVVGRGDYAMTISYVGVGAMFAETEVTGLTIGNEYILKTDTIDVLSNAYRTKVNTVANDNSSTIAEMGWTDSGVRTLTFTATTETVYIAIGDENGASATFSTVDNISLIVDGVEGIANGTFEGNITDPWYPQNGNAVLSVYQYAVEPPVPGDNPYVESVEIPEYAGLPTQCRIPTDAPWSSETFNDAQWTDFYVLPGDYLSTRVTLTLSGTAVQRRTISLYNGNDTHPGQLPLDISNQANTKINISASYWTIDRMSSFNNYSSGDLRQFRILSGAEYNIFNRFYTYETGVSFTFNKETHNNTVQYCRLEDMALACRKADNPGIIFMDWGTTSPWSCKNNKIILNEIKNQCDGIMTMTHKADGTNIQTVDGQGTIIDSNNIWIDDTTYTDGSGNPDVNGVRAYAENGIDFKFGSSSSSNPMVVTNNKMWGYRRSDTTDSSLSDYGAASASHYGVRNVHFNDNITFDSARGFTCSDSQSFPYAWSECEMYRNLFYECGYKGSLSSSNAFVLGEVSDTVVQNNAIVKPLGATDNKYYTKLWFSNTITYTNNDIVDASGFTLYTESLSSSTTTPNNQGTAAELGYTEDVVIDYDIYTNSPKQHILTNAAKA